MAPLSKTTFSALVASARGRDRWCRSQPLPISGGGHCGMTDKIEWCGEATGLMMVPVRLILPFPSSR